MGLSIAKKRKKKAEFGELFFILFVSGTWAANEPQFSGFAGMGMFSKYAFQGYELNDHGTVVQSSLCLGYRGFSFLGETSIRMNISCNLLSLTGPERRVSTR